MPSTPKKKSESNTPPAVPKRLVPSDQKRQSVKPKLFEEANEVHHKEFSIPSGKGTPLGDLENIAHQLNAHKAHDPLMVLLHNVCLGGRVAKRTAVKSNLLKFNGVDVKANNYRQHLESKLARHRMPDLRNVGHFFGVETTGTKEELIKRLSDYLEKPVDSAHVWEGPKTEDKPAKSRSRSSSPAKKRSTKPKAKRAPRKKPAPREKHVSPPIDDLSSKKYNTYDDIFQKYNTDDLLNFVRREKLVGAGSRKKEVIHSILRFQQTGERGSRKVAKKRNSPKKKIEKKN